MKNLDKNACCQTEGTLYNEGQRKSPWSKNQSQHYKIEKMKMKCQGISCQDMHSAQKAFAAIQEAPTNFNRKRKCFPVCFTETVLNGLDLQE